MSCYNTRILITGKGYIMGMTMTQKILADHAGLPKVHAGELIEVGLDMVLGNDVHLLPSKNCQNLRIIRYLTRIR